MIGVDMAGPQNVTIGVNKVVQTFLNLIGNGQGNEALSGIAKILFRLGVGRRNVSDIRAALFLTPAEEAVLLKSGVRFVVKWAGRFYVVATVTDLVVSFLQGEGVVRTPTERLGIVAAHFSKGSPIYTTAFAALEQLVFGLHDAIAPDTNLLDSALELVENVLDFVPPPFAGPPIPPTFELVTDGPDIVPIVEELPEEGQQIMFGQPGHRLFVKIDP
jgi:hypothetical protein